MWTPETNIKGPKGDPGIQGPPGPAGASDWADIANKPATFPPTLPIPQSGVTNLVSDQAAQDTAISGKAPTVHTHAQADVTNLVADLALKAPLASPVFTGDPKAPTPATADNDTSIATTAYVKANLATIVGGAIISDTAPPSPQPGQLWFESDSGNTFIWYADANSSQWVQVNAGGATTDHIRSISADLYYGFRTGPNRWVWNDKADGTGTDVAILSETGAAVFSAVTSSGTITAGANFMSSTIAAVVAATAGIGSGVFLRPNGSGSGTGQFVVEADGLATASGAIVATTGYRVKAGMAAGAGSSVYNINWTGSPQLWIDATNVGTFAFTSDYRIKKDVADLPSQWDVVKALRPISYTQAEYTPTLPPDEDGVSRPAPEPLLTADDIERWGFIAHELQETLTESAATGVKDAENLIQSPNPWTVIAALTKALQEAMARIEALEAANGV